MFFNILWYSFNLPTRQDFRFFCNFAGAFLKKPLPAGRTDINNTGYVACQKARTPVSSDFIQTCRREGPEAEKPL